MMVKLPTFTEHLLFVFFHVSTVRCTTFFIVVCSVEDAASSTPACVTAIKPSASIVLKVRFNLIWRSTTTMYDIPELPWR